MADIFISYSKVGRLAVEQLAAYLEAEGWSVWWDKNLSAGDAFRDGIMRELAKARVVLVLWTTTSIASDWVRAEAGQAKAAGKLIPVKASDVGYDRIPLPFGEMHTEPIENRAQIRAAIVTQLARPAAEPKGLWMAWAEARYATITWIGIIGGAITLFANLKGVVQFADWARLVVEAWLAWSHAIWSRVFGWLKLDIRPLWYPTFTFLGFLASTLIGGRLSLVLARRERADMPAKTTGLRTRHPLAAVSIALLCLMLSLVSITAVFLVREVFALPVLVAGFVAVMATILYFADARLATIGFMLLYLPFPVLLVGGPLYSGHDSRGDFDFEQLGVVAFLVATPTLMAPALALLPARVLNRRFLFLLLGIAILTGLNEVSKLEVLRHFKS